MINAITSVSAGELETRIEQLMHNYRTSVTDVHMGGFFTSKRNKGNEVEHTSRMVDSSVWDQEIAVPESVITFVDDSVSKQLPEGSTVVSIFSHGASYWTRTAEIKTTSSTGDEISFFLKVAQGDIGKGMLYGEFHSMTAIHNAMPNIAPQPIGNGTYKKDSETHFFLCRFHAMKGLPNVTDFPAAVAQLHKNGISPNGKFGFPVTTYQGRLPQNTTECDRWEESFSNGIEQFFKAEEEAQGFDEEMVALRRAIMGKVIPQLLRPLEADGNKIQTCLVHGDLWDGNTSVDSKSNKPLIFDACSSYAHHELTHEIGKLYVAEYLQHFPRSEPVADFDDRNALYCVRFNLCSSALYPGNLRFRRIVKQEMRDLVEKFPLRYEGDSKT
ncbi:Fructosamine/Ketosamine-3-kinase [Penicillium griseofulvum]|uniref:protein-ribulosamine 3-kinase n=1 Tax=Penicillium patulum TaxID=5078 RepID=A0A135LN08_PENPA|nr:Fructosamine/Ketosamine-3-kinase [Penicillium griseofulvum]KXG50319.1 Fructosamine/Ketosamine-3-kinase [Penicillium griseofulvum]